MRQCDLVVVHGPADEAAAARWLPGVRVAYVPSGITLPPVPSGPAQNQTVVFVGSYSHPPNVEGALWLAQQVWPLVLAKCPAARLVLAGRAPPPELLALAGPAVTVLARSPT